VTRLRADAMLASFPSKRLLLRYVSFFPTREALAANLEVCSGVVCMRAVVLAALLLTCASGRDRLRDFDSCRSAFHRGTPRCSHRVSSPCCGATWSLASWSARSASFSGARKRQLSGELSPLVVSAVLSWFLK
jgi:hypothetical protein